MKAKKSKPSDESWKRIKMQCDYQQRSFKVGADSGHEDYEAVMAHKSEEKSLVCTDPC